MRTLRHPGAKREVSKLRQSVRLLDRALRRLVPILTAMVSTNGTLKGNGRSRRLSAKSRASRVLQGRYMGDMRQLKPRQKARVRKTKEAKGVRAAIARAKSSTAS